jgi:drug/metabolite transporter (DMT)-like permease
MGLHQSSGRWQLGLFLALTTSILWGFLAVVLKIVLQVLDANTVTWFRFIIAFGFLAIYLTVTGQFPNYQKLSAISLKLLAVATVCLATNYILFLVGLEKTSPSNAQVLIQLAPVMLGLSSLYIFKEHYNPVQWVGLGVLILGICLFSHEQFQHLIFTSASTGSYLLGNFLLVLAAIAWVVYGLAQKQLLQVLPSPAIMMTIYGGSAILFSPSAHPLQILKLQPWYLGALLFCAVNTLVAYGAFAEALEHWEASRVSAVLALTPLITIAVTLSVSHFFPDLIKLPLVSPLAFIGAIFVVIGSLAISLGSDRNT